MSVIPDSMLHNPDQLVDDYAECLLFSLRCQCDLFEDLCNHRLCFSFPLYLRSSGSIIRLFFSLTVMSACGMVGAATPSQTTVISFVSDLISPQFVLQSSVRS